MSDLLKVRIGGSDYLCKWEEPGSYVKIGGRRYPVVKIGNQEWLAENLDYKFAGCDIGPSGTPSTPAAWYYDDDESTYGIDGTRKCGLLYNWYAVKYLDDNKATLLPAGWHVPTKAEFETLLETVGGKPTAGTKLKASNVSWAASWNGTDDFGFSALPAGIKDYDGEDFLYVGESHNTSFLSSTLDSSGCPNLMRLGYNYAIASISATNMQSGCSIRLVKDLT